jgi:hypothetical protein
MSPAKRQPLAALLVAACLATPTAKACDLAEMQAGIAEMCEGGIAEVAVVLEALAPRATQAERTLIADRLAAARALCAQADPAGIVEAARLARLAGRLEARLGEAPPIWPAREAATQLPWKERNDGNTIR